MPFRLKTLLLLAILIVPKPTHTLDYSAYTITFFQKVFDHCYQWWFGRSDERIASEAIHVLNMLEDQYSPHVTFFKTAFTAIPDTYSQQQQLIEQTHEAVLFQFITQCLEHTSPQLFLQELADAITQLHMQHTILAQQMQDIHKSHEQTANFSVINSSIIALLTYLEFIYEHITAHESYFTIFYYEKTLEKQYQKELRTLEKYADSPQALQHALSASVIKNGSKISHNYQLAGHVKKMQNDLQTFSYALDSVGTRHKNRIFAAKTLMQQLQTIADTLTMHIAQIHGVKKMSNLLGSKNSCCNC
jgi:hypothetical protein